MLSLIKLIINKFFSIFGYGIVNINTLNQQQLAINDLKYENQKYHFLFENNIFNLDILKNLNKSKSQICQDWFVLNSLNYKKNGYFVEIGAASGVDLSNTYLLEKEFNWTGILSEPSNHWRTTLVENRDCNIDFNCVYKSSGEKINFYETIEKEYSTIGKYSKQDNHFSKRKSFKEYEVETISLLDLLDKYNAPRFIDYLSIDTEGSELDIILNFDFSKYKFRVVTIEHNNTENEIKIDKIFKENGYTKTYEKFSQFESWFVYRETI